MAFTLLNPIYPRPHIPAGKNTVAPGIMLAVTSASAANFTSANFDAGCELVVFDIQSNNVMVTFDGSTPASGTTGHILQNGTNYTMQLSSVLAAKFQSLNGAANIYASQWSM